MRQNRSLYLCLSTLLSLAGPGGGTFLAAQAPPRLPLDSVSLETLSAFRAPASNWRLAGEVSVDRRRPQRFVLQEGTGVLVNVAAAREGEHLFTGWEHGDLELEVDFMMPEGSNSGLYLQGRYEIQLFDSWGVKSPSYSDAAGIYQRWDPQRGRGREGFEGHPPRVNASRAPGLWQSLRIVFRAPRFDAQGRKIANARFVRVEHNGVAVHENIEVTGPTRGSAFEDERPTGPLMIQGDHGPVAFRGLRYKRYGEERVRVSDVSYRVYEGEFAGLPDLAARRPVSEGPATGIHTEMVAAPDQFALVLDGTVQVPASGRYLFDLNLGWIESDPHFQDQTLGAGRLLIGDRQVLLHPGRARSHAAEVSLEAGRHPFSLTLFKNRRGRPPAVALHVEGPGMARHALHEAGPPSPSSRPGPILVEPKGEPTVIRGFMNHGETKRTHVVAVGDPTGVHFSFDAERAGLLYAWRGPFLEATDMWHGRGQDQLAEPLGSVLVLSGAPALAVLGDPDAAWPDSLGEGRGYRFRGYDLDPAGRPTFRYRQSGLEVEDRIRPSDDGTTLHRQLRIRGADGTAGVFARLAEGERILPRPDGSYAVGDLVYYVRPERGPARPVVRRQGGREELLVPVRFRDGQARVSYEIIW